MYMVVYIVALLMSILYSLNKDTCWYIVTSSSYSLSFDINSHAIHLMCIHNNHDNENVVSVNIYIVVTV